GSDLEPVEPVDGRPGTVAIASHQGPVDVVSLHRLLRVAEHGPDVETIVGEALGGVAADADLGGDLRWRNRPRDVAGQKLHRLGGAAELGLEEVTRPLADVAIDAGDVG